MRYRGEIDGLRALAVIAVVGYHYFPALFARGFLGVDVFFVISGYVISGSLHDRDRRGFELLLDFWVRRVRRLLPALLVCIVFFLLLFLLLTSRPEPRVITTASAAMLGLSNIYLYSRSFDYFGLNALLNPYTHTWSLGVEEQFYFLYAIFFAFMVSRGRMDRRPYHLYWLCLCAAGSWLAYVLHAPRDAEAVFYLPQYRIWEILLGCIAYELRTLGRNRCESAAIPFAAIMVVLCCLFLNVGSAVLATTLVCLGTAVLVLALESDRESVIKRVLDQSAMRYVGRISYSLYLYHWPWLVLAALTIGNSPAALALTLLLSVLSATASFHFIENHFRYRWSVSANWTTLGAILIMLPALALLNFRFTPRFVQEESTVLAKWFGIRSAEIWRVPCHLTGNEEQLETHLQTCLSEAPDPAADIYLLGDSHAAQLSFPLAKVAAARQGRLHFINTQGPDFPYSFIYPHPVSGDRIFNHLLRVLGPEDTVVIAFHRGRLNERIDAHVDIDQAFVANPKAMNFEANAAHWFAAIERRGAKILLVRDTPLLSYVTTVETCALQHKLWGETACEVSRQQDLHTRRQQDVVFDNLQKRFPETVRIYDPTDVLFGESEVFSPIAADGSYRMVDWNHLARNEAMRLAGPLGELLRAD